MNRRSLLYNRENSEVNDPQTLQKHHIIKHDSKANKTLSTARGQSLNLETKCFFFFLHKKLKEAESRCKSQLSSAPSRY